LTYSNGIKVFWEGKEYRSVFEIKVYTCFDPNCEICNYNPLSEVADICV